MKILALLLTLSAFINAQNQDPRDIFSVQLHECDLYEDVTEDYRNSLYEFAIESYKQLAPRAINHFVLGSLSGWLTLATIAEATDPETRRFMFQFLNLPSDPCKRLKYYRIITSQFVPNEDVNLTNTRTLIIDEELDINPIFHNFVFQNFLLDVVSAPMRNDPQTTLEEIRRISEANLPNLDLSGNSIILDAVDFTGILKSAFIHAVVEKAPFYGKTGEQIGSVDLMRIKRRVKTSFLESIQVKTIEIPIGDNDRYLLFFGIPVDNNIGRAFNGTRGWIIHEYLSNLQDSEVPINIAIPQMSITSEYNVKKILEDFGIKNLWTDPSVTRFMSVPSALPSAYEQRATFSLKAADQKTAPLDSSSYVTLTDVDATNGQDFIANRPFFFGLMDSKTYVGILAGSYTTPTYTD